MGQPPVPLDVASPPEILAELGRRVRARRLEIGWTQEELAARAGLSLASYRRFEHSGNAPLASLVNVAIALDAVAGFDGLFPDRPRSIDALLARPRQRGRRKP